MDTFLLVFAALFPVVNPPGTALVFLSMTKHASIATRRLLARRVAVNAFFVMAASLLGGAFVLKIYGISVPVLRVAGGLIIAVAGRRLLNEGSHKDESSTQGHKTDYESQTFYPLTLPLTTGPGTTNRRSRSRSSLP
jgi:multiple antibiotic resistance protein